MRLSSIVLVLPLVALSLAGCAAAPAPSAPPAAESAPNAAPAAKGLADRDPALAHKLVREGGVLLDVRTQEEWASGHAEGALHVPVQELDARLEEIAKATGGDKTKAIVVYCKSGKRAGAAKEKLVSAGYENVTNVGSLSDWESVK